MVADLLDSLILSRTEKKKKNFLSKLSPQVKLFAILARIDTNLRCIKDCVLLRIKQTDEMSRVCVLRISMKPCKLQGRTASFQGGLDKNSLCQKCQEGA